MAQIINPQTPSISVMLPTFNEALNICELLTRTYALLRPQDEILVIDDNSPDQTAKIAQNFSQDKPNIKIICRKNNRGLTASLRDGIKECKNEIIIWLDADLSQPPEHIPLLINELIEKKGRIVVASRYVNGGEDVRGNSGLPLIKFQVFLSNTLRNLAKFILTDKFNDWSSGYICLYKKTLENLSPLEGAHGEYFIPLIYQAIIQGQKVLEFPYTLTPRQKGESKTGTSFLGMCKTGTQYLLLLLKTRWRFCHYRSTSASACIKE